MALCKWPRQMKAKEGLRNEVVPEGKSTAAASKVAEDRLPILFNLSTRHQTHRFRHEYFRDYHHSRAKPTCIRQPFENVHGCKRA